MAERIGMPVHARGPLMRAVAVGAAVLLTLAGCSPNDVPVHPDPLPIVASYLDALASGDSATAMALDAVAFEDAPFTQGAGTGVLETGALAAASERIVVGGATVLSADEDSAAVATEFSLAGQQYTPKLRLRWNDDAESWELIDSLANLLEVRTVTPAGVPGPAPFTLEGFAPTGTFDGYDPPATYVYPGVYALSVQLDPAVLADPSTPLDRDIVVPPLYRAPQESEFVANVDFALR